MPTSAPTFRRLAQNCAARKSIRGSWTKRPHPQNPRTEAPATPNRNPGGIRPMPTANATPADRRHRWHTPTADAPRTKRPSGHRDRLRTPSMAISIHSRNRPSREGILSCVASLELSQGPKFRSLHTYIIIWLYDYIVIYIYIYTYVYIYVYIII